MQLCARTSARGSAHPTHRGWLADAMADAGRHAAPRRGVEDPNGLDRSISACYGVARIQEP